MKNIKCMLLPFVVAMLPLTSNAQQQENGAYIIAGVGVAEYDLDGIDLDDDSDTVFMIGAGHQFNENVAIELAYNNFGSVQTEVADIELDAVSYSVAAVGSLPMGASKRFALTAKLGLEYLDAEAATTFDILGNQVSIEESDSSVEVLAGVGMRYALNNLIDFRLDIDGHDGGDVMIVTGGIKFKF